MQRLNTRILLSALFGVFFLCSSASTVYGRDSISHTSLVGIEFVGLSNRGLFTYTTDVASLGSIHLSVFSGVGFNRFMNFQNEFSPDIVVPLGVKARNANFNNFHLSAGGVLASIQTAVVSQTSVAVEKERSFTFNPYAGIGYKHPFSDSKYSVGLEYYFIYDRNDRPKHSMGLALEYKLR